MRNTEDRTDVDADCGDGLWKATAAAAGTEAAAERGLATRGLATLAVRAGLDRSPHGETAEALFLNSGYVYDDAARAEARFRGEEPGFVYSRYGNPTVRTFEARLAALEGAEACRATASGMSAVWNALICQLRAGDHIVAAEALFGSCQYILAELLPRFGITTSFVRGADLDAWAAAVRPETKLFFLETPSNPQLELIDLAAVAEIAHAHGATLVVDNVFATPILQKPMALGADVVVYSATKHIDGQGRVLGGAILASEAFCDGALRDFLRHTGPTLSAFNAWVLLKGLETLPLRVREQTRSAATLARRFEGHPALNRLVYPGLASHPGHDLARRQMAGGGTLLAFDFKGGKEAAFRFLNRLEIADISNNLGDAKTLATHPATTTHQRLPAEVRAAVGIGDGLVRVSIGLEDVEDLAADLAAALDAA